MPIYTGKTPGTWRVVVWANGKPHERIARGPKGANVPHSAAVALELRMRDELGARNDVMPASLTEDEVSNIVFIGGAPKYVYFVRAGKDGPIKIGYSRQAGVRLSGMQIGSAVRLHLLCVVPGGRALERTIHKAFDGQRLDGEWFRPSKELLLLIEELSYAVRPEIMDPSSRKAAKESA